MNFKLPHRASPVVVLLALGISLCVAGPALAQLPLARLSTVFPPGAKQGTAVDVTVTGQDLDEIKALHFSHPGLTAAPKTDAATGQPVPNTFVVTVAADVPPGVYDVHAAGRFGVTNPRAFRVGMLPESPNKPGNTAPESAAELPVGSAVHALAEANAAHYFKLTLA